MRRRPMRGRPAPGTGKLEGRGPFALLWPAAGLSLVLVLLSLADGRGIRRLGLLRGDVARAEAANEALRARNAELARTVQKLGTRIDPRALERAAREQLGFVKQDQLLFKFE